MKTILVIEDNDEVLENICEILELSGYRTHAACDGSEGVNIAIRERPDLILCDVMMPKLDGFGVLKILRSNKITSDIPLVFLTARVDKEDFRKGMGLGADDYITKPFDDTELLSAIEIRLERHAKHLETFTDAPQNLNTDFSHADWLKTEIENGIIKHLDKNEVLFREGEQARHIYYVKEGLFKELQTSSLGKSLICSFYNSGELIGSNQIFKDGERESTIVALTNSTVISISIDQAKRFISNNRLAAHHLLKSVIEKNHQLKLRLIEIAYDDVRKKVANAIITSDQLRKLHPDYQPGREELATLAGIAKETFIRTLSAFKSEGLVSIEQRMIKVLKMDALKQIQ